jgi:hypothetical protein
MATGNPQLLFAHKWCPMLEAKVALPIREYQALYRCGSDKIISSTPSEHKGDGCLIEKVGPGLAHSWPLVASD